MSDGINDSLRGAEVRACTCRNDMVDFYCPIHGGAQARVGGTIGAVVERINHPLHYGGADNPYEAIKIIEHWQLGFCLGNVVKYILRAPHKADYLADLKKAAWYLNREIEREEKADRS